MGLLEFELREIEALAPDEAEHEQLLAARERLRRSDALRSAAGAGAEALSPESAERRRERPSCWPRRPAQLDGIAGVDPGLDAMAERLGAALIEAQELAGELRELLRAADWTGSAWTWRVSSRRSSRSKSACRASSG